MNNKMNITVFTIVYNGYGRFLNGWLRAIKKQTPQPKEIIVVLGKNHGVEERPDGVKFIECDSDVMGELRNEAIRAKRFKKCLYFSVDDELLPEGLAEIEKKFNQGYDVVGLTFYDMVIIGHKEDGRTGEVTDIHVNANRRSYLPDNPREWRKSVVPGWVAVNGTYEYEPIGIPNYPYLFKLKSQNLAMGHTDIPVAMYKRRKGSHGDIAKEGNKINAYAEEIDSWVKKYDY